VGPRLKSSGFSKPVYWVVLFGVMLCTGGFAFGIASWATSNPEPRTSALQSPRATDDVFAPPGPSAYDTITPYKGRTRN